MNVSYLAPLHRAWARMMRMLFPFRAEMWFVLGFAAFLAGPSGFKGPHAGFSTHRHVEIPHTIIRAIVDFLHNPLAVALVLWIVIAILVGFVLLTWISSRFMFIFLDNVAHERRGIVEPWKRFKRLGNSLFVWRLGLLFVILLAIGAFMFSALPALASLAHSENGDISQLLVLLPLVLMALPFALLIAFVHMLLTSFVVPIMYRHELSAGAAWSRFLGLFGQHLLSFILYGLFVLVLSIGTAIAILLFGIATCCVGFLVLGIPYIGSVLALPISVTARALGPEFLAQFGPDLVALAPAPATGGSAPPPVSPSAGTPHA